MNHPKITFKNLFSRYSIVLLMKILTPGVGLFLLLALFYNSLGIKPAIYTRDAIQVLGGKPYDGFVSTLGIFLWTAAAAILFFSALLALKKNKLKTLIGFLVFGGIFTTLMLMDDAFLFHDVIFPEYLSISENIFYTSYGLILVSFLFLYRKFIVETDYILLLLAFALFVCSAGTDQIIAFFGSFHGQYLVEDGCKFLGISCWFAYFARTSYSAILSEVYT